jgi:hypothetical protein
MGMFGRFRPGGGDHGYMANSGGNTGSLMGGLPRRPGSQPPVTPLKGGVGTPQDKRDPNAVASARQQGKRNNEIRDYNNSKGIDIDRINAASTKKSAMMNKYPAPGAGNTEDQADKVARRKGWSY